MNRRWTVEVTERSPDQEADRQSPNNTFKTVILWVTLIAVAVVLWRMIAAPPVYKTLPSLAGFPEDIVSSSQDSKQALDLYQKKVLAANDFAASNPKLDCGSRAKLEQLVHDADFQGGMVMDEIRTIATNWEKWNRAAKFDLGQQYTFSAWAGAIQNNRLILLDQLKTAQASLQKGSKLNCT